MAAQTDADSNDFDDRFRRHFPRRSKDFTLVVLKGHLLVEESVNRLLAVLLPVPEAIEGANLRFHQKLCLIRALIPARIYPVDAAEKLNTLRNRLAHHLDYPQIEVLVKDFLSLSEPPLGGSVQSHPLPDDPAHWPRDPKIEGMPLIRRLRRAIVSVCAMIEEIYEAAKATRDLTGDPFGRRPPVARPPVAGMTRLPPGPH
jgi:hypothetical protein